MYSLESVQYALAVSSHMPIRLVSDCQSSTYRCTDDRHLALNRSMP